MARNRHSVFSNYHYRGNTPKHLKQNLRDYISFPFLFHFETNTSKKYMAFSPTISKQPKISQLPAHTESMMDSHYASFCFLGFCYFFFFFFGLTGEFFSSVFSVCLEQPCNSIIKENQGSESKIRRLIAHWLMLQNSFYISFECSF